MKKQIAVLVLVGLLVAIFSLGIGDESRAGAKKLTDWDSIVSYWGTDLIATDSTRAAGLDLFDPIRVANENAGLRYDRAIGALYVPTWTASDTDALGARDTIIMLIYGYCPVTNCSLLIDSQIKVKTDSTCHTFFIDIDDDNYFAGTVDTQTAFLVPKDQKHAFAFDWWRVFITRADSARAGMVEAGDSAYMSGIHLWLRFEEEE